MPPAIDLGELVLVIAPKNLLGLSI